MNSCIPKISKDSLRRNSNVVDLTTIRIDPNNENAIIPFNNDPNQISGLGSEPSDSSMTLSDNSNNNILLHFFTLQIVNTIF